MPINKPADVGLGQPDFTANSENRWKAVIHDTLCWPYGIYLHRGTLAVADSGNNRVMLWDVQHKRTSSSTSFHND